MLNEIFKNKFPSKITHYTVNSSAEKNAKAQRLNKSDYILDYLDSKILPSVITLDVLTLLHTSLMIGLQLLSLRLGLMMF